MILNEVSNKILDQTKDLIWVVDSDLTLVYANKAYLSLMKEVTGIDKVLNTPILVEGFGEGYIEKWKAYYQRALSGEYFEVEEHYYNPESNDIQYGQITFTPVIGDDDRTHSVACRSTDITRIVKHKSEANQLLDASLDTFCTINEAGNFVFVSAASKPHWGYTPEELRGMSFWDLILEDDLPKPEK
ncbi:PAS domain-containing protein [Aquiflexum sp.]|uniref:PAS domain-containing protein n=1 Tax=Aquiflexum sp. TaxID=1872584 RepID=UPI0035934CC0